jgi:glycosyltransferase involved in cell wall biosynthesis
MFRHFDGKVARRLRDLNVDAAYAYEGNALQTFRQAKTQGVRTFYELPSSHWYWEQKLLSAEAEQNPEFAGLSPQLNDSVRHLTEKDEELLLADLIFVPSQHVRGTLAGIVPEEKIRVIGYGAPPLRAVKRMCMVSGGPLKVLFAGSLSQRKGIGYLLDAIDLLGSQVELTLLGKRIGAHPRVDEACRRWRWIESLPHSEVLDLMQQADVLVLPSLSEGCALVVLEALACGLPVIVTPNTGTLESVRDGCEGFVVPICRSDAIADRLNILNHDRELLGEMSRNAQAAAARRSWETYRNDWAEAMKGAL